MKEGGKEGGREGDTYILMPKVPQQFDLTQDALGVHDIIEGARNFLNGDLATGQVVGGGAVRDEKRGWVGEKEGRVSI